MRTRLVLVALLAACGRGADGATVEATFARGSRTAATSVWVAESERSTAADSAGFRVSDLTPGPVSLRVMAGEDTAAVLDVAGLPPGGRLVLRDLRIDPETRLAYPRAVDLRGARVVTVNGIRVGERLPSRVDARGAVLAWAPESGALLVRPADAKLPDLRVVVRAETALESTAGGRADPATLQRGDSLTVQGRTQSGYVIAERVIVSARLASPIAETVDVAASPVSAAPAQPDPPAVANRSASTVTAAPAVAVNERASRGGKEHGRGKGGARGKGKGRGRD